LWNQPDPGIQECMVAATATRSVRSREPTQEISMI
jgi:hypothetical protein